MRSLLFIGVLMSFAINANGEGKFECGARPFDLVDFPKHWITMAIGCTKKMKEQVMIELNAAITYMAMGSHFSRDKVNRPGFAKMFFESASEERQHAIKLIEYLLMRGDTFNNLNQLINKVPSVSRTWYSGKDALNAALKLEADVTRNILGIIKECENSTDKRKDIKDLKLHNDYHLVDYLTGVYLEEQYKGQQDLAEKLSTLSKMMKNHGALGEFLFDKKLLSGQL